MAAVATAPPSSALAGSPINRPTSAASESRRSASATSRNDSPAVPTVPIVAEDDVEEKEPVKDDDDSESSFRLELTAESPPQPPSPRAAPAVIPNRPPIRPIPAIRSKFDLEPNPFEQSFRESHHSDSLEDVNEFSGPTPPRGGDATAIKHNALPPLSSLTSPAAADPSQFPWLATQGLRSGPLSPAMLTGPQGARPKNGEAEHGAFDSSTFRTGFTPGTGSGFTPGFTSLMGGAGFSNLPLPSPNTAAFLNMVTNATPEGEAGEQPQPTQHNSQNPPSAIPPHLQPHHGLSHITNHTDINQDTITPNTLSALTGVVNDMNRQINGINGHPQNFYPHRPPTGNGANGPPGPGYPHVDYAQQSANAASQAANGLFLLSQAHQELSKREEETRGPSSGPGGPGGPPPQGMPPQMTMSGMGGMAPGAAHGHNMTYPGHPGYNGQLPSGLSGHPIPSSSLLQHYQQHSTPTLGGHQPLPGQNGPTSALMGKRNSSGPSAATLASAAATIMGNGAPQPPPPASAPTTAVPAAGGRKRKSDAAEAGLAGGKAKKGKKGAAGASPGPEKGKGMKGESTSPMGMGSYSMRGMGMMGPDDDDEDMESEHDGISKITGKPETEEEKRKNFLERNRQAALKCRQRKKQWLNELQSKVEQLQLENDRLNQTVAGLHDEIGRLSGVLIQHRDCGLGLPTGYGRGPLR